MVLFDDTKENLESVKNLGVLGKLIDKNIGISWKDIFIGTEKILFN